MDELKLLSKDIANIRKQCEMVTEKCFEVQKERIFCEDNQDKLKFHIDKLENTEIIGAKKEVKKAEAEGVRKTELYKLQTQNYLEQQELEFHKKLKAHFLKDMEMEAKIDITEVLYEQDIEARRMEKFERLKAKILAAAEQEGKHKSDF